MDGDMSARFIASLTKSLQAVIHGCLDFEKDIEVGGYVYVRVDSTQRVDYVLSEKMQKSDVNSMTFLSNSFHAVPQAASEQNKPPHEKDGSSASVAESAGKSADNERTHSRSSELESSRFSASQSSSKSSHQNAVSGNTRRSDSFLQLQNDSSEGLNSPSNSLKWSHLGSKTSAQTTSQSSRSSERTQSLTDFQTAFRNPPTTFTSQPQQSSSTSHKLNFSQNGSSSRQSSSQPLHHHQQHQQQYQQQQQGNKSSILPDATEMEVIHIKTEEEDEVFSLPLQCQQGSADHEGLIAQGKAPWLAMKMRQPFYFPYHRLARSQSWDRQASMAGSSPRYPFFPGESSFDASSLTCKICGKSYRSRQGLLFHERAKHQNVFNVYCPVCGKGFQQTTHMHGHMATHTNDKKFQCQACGAKYAHKTSLQQHVRSGSCRSSQMGNPAGLDLSTSQILRELAPYSLNEEQPRSSPSHSHQNQSPHGDFSHDQVETEMTLHQRQSSSFSHSDLSSPECTSATFNGEKRRDKPSGQTTALNRIDGDLSSGLNRTDGDELDQEHGVDMTKQPQTFGAADLTGSVDGNAVHGQNAVYQHDADTPETLSLSLSADDE